MQATKRNPSPRSNQATVETLADDPLASDIVAAAEIVSAADIASDTRTNDQSVRRKKNGGLRGPFDFGFANIATAILWAIVGLIILRLIA